MPSLRRTLMGLGMGLGLLAAAVATAMPADAQSFPSRPIRIVIGFPAGGGIDIVARLIAPKLTEALGQPVIVENRPGAAGVVATAAVAAAEPDGHSILFATTGNLVVNPVIYRDLPFDVGRDFAPLTQVSSVAFMLMVTPSLPVTTLGDLIARARAAPGALNYSTSGNGGMPHLAAELFNTLAGVKTVHVPYKGSAPSINDLIGGHVQFSFDAIAIALPYVQSGKLRALATTGAVRSAVLPEVPAAVETLPGFEVVNWYGMVVPARTPAPVIARLQAEIAKVLAVPEMRDRLVGLGADPVGSTPEQFGAFLKAEAVKWGTVVRQADVKAE